MGVQLSKGERFDIFPDNPNLQKVSFALGWQINETKDNFDIDASVFMLGADGKIPQERYFVFYNNLRSFDDSVHHLGNHQTGKNQGDKETINVDFHKISPGIQEIIFVVTIHEAQAKNQNFSQIQNAFIRLYNSETDSELACYNLQDNFSRETAVEFGRLYKKNGKWRFQAVGQGYNAGLKSFVDKYYVEIKQEDNQPETNLNNSDVDIPDLAINELAATELKIPEVEIPELKIPELAITELATPKVSNKNQKAIALEKKLEEKAPHIFNLVKKADISLQKANLTNHDAKVALCLDISVSMSALYSAGKIQRLAEKILALGCRFDDNAAIDIFLFGINSYYAGEMTIENFPNFIHHILKRYPLEGGTYYGRVMQEIRNFYFPDSRDGSRYAPISADKPVYVMFVTDGATTDESATKQQLQWSSYEALFWQFMAIGKSQKDVKRKGVGGWFSRATASDFSFLEQLDEMGDRHLDNADFFSVEDPESIADEELYDLLTTEYPNWVKSARLKNLLPYS
ncbi:MAG: TerD family protein [Microcoleus sp.]